ncbi:MAG: branched-chain amino acid aminotransferase [Planctomycetaceae bacterium]|jgi:Flp pilus assembly pilin Flp|nr:branched-chain amino acid aminotransferase [Planctomycetaceae bacterium]
MTSLTRKLWNDDAGFVVSSELVLVATIVVLGMVVGLSELSHGINQELEDVASAFGAVNQSFCYRGLSGHLGDTGGSHFGDYVDFCDSANDVVCDALASGEVGNHHHN